MYLPGEGAKKKRGKQLLGNRGCEAWKRLDLSWLVGQWAVNHWAVRLPAASFVVSATLLEGEELLWLLAFQQMEPLGVCAALQLVQSCVITQ